MIGKFPPFLSFFSLWGESKETGHKSRENRTHTPSAAKTLMTTKKGENKEHHRKARTEE